MNTAKRDRRVVLSTIVALAVALGLLCLLSDPGDEGLVGESGQSFIIDDQFVIVDNGYRFGKITYAVVRNWPVSSSVEERLEDDRLIIAGVDRPHIRTPDGNYKLVEDVPQLYFFDDYNLTKLPISMQEDDFVDFHPETMARYSDVLGFFQSYKTGG